MNTPTIKSLERAALDAHRIGQPWPAFWQVHWRDVSKAAGRSRRRFDALLHRLLDLVVSGDGSPAVAPVGNAGGNVCGNSTGRKPRFCRENIVPTLDCVSGAGETCHNRMVSE